MAGPAPSPRSRPIHYICPSCHLYLLSWDQPTQSVEMFHKVGLWEDFWTREVRLICQYCLGATDILDQRLVELLRNRFGLAPTGGALRRSLP